MAGAENEAGRLLAQEGERYRLGTAVGIRFPAVDSAAGFGVVTRCLCAVLGDEYQEEGYGWVRDEG